MYPEFVVFEILNYLIKFKIIWFLTKPLTLYVLINQNTF